MEKLTVLVVLLCIASSVAQLLMGPNGLPFGVSILVVPILFSNNNPERIYFRYAQSRVTVINAKLKQSKP